MARGTPGAEAWEHFARTDADWAVLTDPALRGGGWSNRLDEFYASGVSDVRKHLGDLPLTVRRQLAIDWGCGTGRLTFALAAEFEQVIGVDVARSMLETAATRASERGVTNVVWATVDEVGPRRADLVYSLHVLQHLPSSSAMVRALEAMCTRVTVGGYLIVDIPTSLHRARALVQPRYRWWSLLTSLGTAEKTARRLGGQGMSMRALNRSRVGSIITGQGLEIVSMTETRAGTVTSGHYVAVRRA